MKRYIPEFLLIVGIAWIIGSTVFLQFHFHYGWLPQYSETLRSNVPIEKQTVQKAFMQYGREGWDYVSYQMLPAALMIVGVFWRICILRRESKKTVS
jgi:uncharacterized protein YneF (UPF0154 family)